MKRKKETDEEEATRKETAKKQGELIALSRDGLVPVRSDALKSLGQLIEANPKMSVAERFKRAIRERLIDTSPTVRVAAFELLGKCIVARPKLLDHFYPQLIDRLKDPSVAVRKQVITVLRDTIEVHADEGRRNEILAMIVQRIDDEPSIQKLCVDTFRQLWFVTAKEEENEKDSLKAKIRSIVNVTFLCELDGKLAPLEKLFGEILANQQVSAKRTADAMTLGDAMVNHVLELDTKLSSNSRVEEQMDESTMSHDVTLRRMGRQIDDDWSEFLATLSALALIARTSPELLTSHAQFFLSYVKPPRGPMRSRMLCQILLLLEAVIPSMLHPTKSFIVDADTRLCQVVSEGGVKVITVAVRCLKSVLNCAPNYKSGIVKQFLMQYKYLVTLRERLEADPNFKFETPQVKQNAMRCLYTLGAMFRYFHFDEMLDSDANEEILANNQRLNESDESLEPRIAERSNDAAARPQLLREYVFACLLYFAGYHQIDLCLKSLAALGQMVAGWVLFASDAELNSLYERVLEAPGDELDAHKVQVMNNLTSFILAQADTERSINEQIRVDRASGVGLTELKTMESIPAELSSRIVQAHWSSILSCYSRSTDRVRIATAKLVWQILQDGLVSPASAISVLLEMSNDPLESIRVQMREKYEETVKRYPEIRKMVERKKSAYDYSVDIARYGEDQ